jgi:hypothetical protein
MVTRVTGDNKAGFGHAAHAAAATPVTIAPCRLAFSGATSTMMEIDCSRFMPLDFACATADGGSRPGLSSHLNRHLFEIKVTSLSRQWSRIEATPPAA